MSNNSAWQKQSIKYLEDKTAKLGGARDVQRELVEIVCDTVENGGQVLVEAPTGSGKSYAELIPAICDDATPSKRWLFVTATNSLSNQLVNKDLPYLTARKNLYGVYKAVNNYVCPAKLSVASGVNKPLFDWAKKTGGDRYAAPHHSKREWAQISTSKAGCKGFDVCAFRNDCTAAVNSRQANKAKIVVTSQATLGAMLGSGKDFLGEFDVIVSDEVHELPAYLRESLTGRLNKNFLNSFNNHVVRLERSGYGRVDKDLVELVRGITNKAISDTSGKYPDPKIFVPVINALSMHLDSIKESRIFKEIVEESREVSRFIDVFRTLSNTGDDWVRWVDNGYHCGPLTIDKQFQYFLSGKSFIGLSATVDSFVGLELGVRDVRFCQPVFDPNNLSIVIPSGFPSPKDRSTHLKEFSKLTRQTTKCLGGYTLVLCTSLDSVKYLCSELNIDGIEVLDATKGINSKIASFKKSGGKNMVLVGTGALWTGTDLPGCVKALMIEKLPFPPPTDVIARKQADSIPGGFMKVTVPKCALMLRQGIGRAIRQDSDQALCVICDPRLANTNYGRAILSTIPREHFDSIDTVKEGVRWILDEMIAE